MEEIAQQPFEGKRILVTGGTGSLGRHAVRAILSGAMGRPAKVVVYSRDEAKQHEMRLAYMHREEATDEVIYQNFRELLSFRIGDVRDYPALLRAMSESEIVLHAAALKQVPTCEYFPFEAVQTNVLGAQNLVRVVRENQTPVELVVGVSTDKACKPVNVMGMTKALQERILIEGNRDAATRFVCVRYGNVIASRGSVIPLFVRQIESGGPVTVTLAEMTRFLLHLDKAVETIFAAARQALPGEIYVPQVPSARVLDLAKVLIGERDISIQFTGIRPGEKIHEVMVSEEECQRTVKRGEYYAIAPILPETRPDPPPSDVLKEEYSSRLVTLGKAGLTRLLAPYLEGCLSEVAS